MSIVSEWLKHARTSRHRPTDPVGGRMFDAVIVAMHKWPYLPSNPVMEQRARIVVDELRAAGFSEAQPESSRSHAAHDRTQRTLSARQPRSQSASTSVPQR